jgi:tRNA1Val (adenine37-N6)-methyltransferase
MYRNSPWKERINVICGDVLAYPFSKSYDLIICNPPFFRNSLQAPTDARNKARHDVSLSYEQLSDMLKTLLAPGGYASILLPHNEHSIWEQVLKQRDLYVSYKYMVRPSAGANVNRVISLCGTPEQIVNEEYLVIYEPGHTYTVAFIQLMKSFYLKL